MIFSALVYRVWFVFVADQWPNRKDVSQKESCPMPSDRWPASCVG